MYETQVRRGAALLDRLQPNWFRMIAADLAMQTCDRCILGQLYGNYATGFWTITRPLPAAKLFLASDHGFTLPENEQIEDDPESMERFHQLTEAWQTLIRERIRS